jgi:hypothetical protein
MDVERRLVLAANETMRSYDDDSAWFPVMLDRLILVWLQAGMTVL